ncbi:MAG: GerMN domain-containing protein [Oscillatoria princeps RMCB-10]|jgi:spore germination protein GerM|nr:GerMN domain-containing protein [Oscillatoria princeps RMCB-10]
MQEQKSGRRISPALLAGGAALAILAGGGGTAWWLTHSRTGPEPPSVQIPVPAPAVKPTILPSVPLKPGQKAVQVFWVRDAGTNLDLVPGQINVDKASQPNAVLTAAFNRLLSGSVPAGVSSAIPQGTKLRSVAVKNDGVHVDLSPEFKTGGGSASMIARLAQVIYTATSLDENAKVWISVDGKRLEVLGGEGLEVAQPITRQSFQKNFSL